MVEGTQGSAVCAYRAATAPVRAGLSRFRLSGLAVLLCLLFSPWAAGVSLGEALAGAPPQVGTSPAPAEGSQETQAILRQRMTRAPAGALRSRTPASASAVHPARVIVQPLAATTPPSQPVARVDTAPRQHLTRGPPR